VLLVVALLVGLLKKNWKNPVLNINIIMHFAQLVSRVKLGTSKAIGVQILIDNIALQIGYHKAAGDYAKRIKGNCISSKSNCFAAKIA
jgi:hypothetical protein